MQDVPRPSVSYMLAAIFVADATVIKALTPTRDIITH